MNFFKFEKKNPTCWERYDFRKFRLKNTMDEMKAIKDKDPH
jgi:hypothetical protein